MLLKSLLFLILISFAESLCPPGSLEWKSNCFLFNTTESEYASAEISCIRLNGHLASIHDAFTNMVLGTEAQNYFDGSTYSNFWIGADNIEIFQKWTWTDGTPFDYNDWNTGEPQNVTGSNCVALSLTEAYWAAEDCFKRKPYVCLLPNVQPSTTTTPKPTTRPPPCPQNWYLYSGFCYGVYHNQNQAGAEQVCTRQGAHLASIHSKDENEFIGNLPFQVGGTWIGLFTMDSCVSCQRTWNWTDGSSIDYANWDQGEPNNQDVIENCVRIYQNYPYTWNDVPCTEMYENFICKKKAV